MARRTYCIPALCSCCYDSGLIQNHCRASHFRHSKYHQRCIRLGLDTTVCVVNVDIGVAEFGGGPCQFARPVRKLHLSNLSFRVTDSLSIQDRLRRSVFVDDNAHQDCFLRGDGLKSQDVYVAVRERPANFSKRSRPIVHAMVNSLAIGMLETSYIPVQIELSKLRGVARESYVYYSADTSVTPRRVGAQKTHVQPIPVHG